MGSGLNGRNTMRSAENIVIMITIFIILAIVTTIIVIAITRVHKHLGPAELAVVVGSGRSAASPPPPHQLRPLPTSPYLSPRRKHKKAYPYHQPFRAVCSSVGATIFGAIQDMKSILQNPE